MNYKLSTSTSEMPVTTRAIVTLLQLAGAEPESELFHTLDQGGTLTLDQSKSLASRVPTFGKADLREDEARFILEAAASGEPLTVVKEQRWPAASETLPLREKWVTPTTVELDRTGWREHPAGGDDLLAEYEQLLLDTLLSLDVDLQQGRAIEDLWGLYRTRRLPRLTDKNLPSVTDPDRYEAMLRVIEAMDLSLGADTFRDISDDQVTFWNRTSDWLSSTPWSASHSFRVHQQQPRPTWGMYKVWLEPVGPTICAAQTAFEGEQQ